MPIKYIKPLACGMQLAKDSCPDHTYFDLLLSQESISPLLFKSHHAPIFRIPFSPILEYNTYSLDIIVCQALSQMLINDG